eukprot:3885038-Prymnesium_polylepis.1
MSPVDVSHPPLPRGQAMHHETRYVDVKQSDWPLSIKGLKTDTWGYEAGRDVSVNRQYLCARIWLRCRRGD